MQVTVELPDPPRIEPLLQSLNDQYQEVIQRLLRLQEEGQKENRYAPLLQALQGQQDRLVQAFEHLMGMMHESHQADQQTMHALMAPQQQQGEALLSAVCGMKRSLTSLPDELSTTMDKHFRTRQQTIVKQATTASASRSSPASTRPAASQTAVVKALGRLEAAVVAGLKRSRNRTFGSNF